MLFVCATPIGNLSDTSHRLVATLKQADAIAAEDTRRAKQLLAHYHISAPPLFRLDQHNEHDGRHPIIQLLKEKKRVVLISDAGTPAISDPGAALISYCIKHTIPVCPIPGPSAVTTLLSIAGFDASLFTFAGFFPRNTLSARKLLQQLSHTQGPVVFFESPKRLVKTLSFLSTFCPHQRMVCAKELTKLYEHIFYGSVQSVYTQVQTTPLKGEWCFALDLPHPDTLHISALVPALKNLDLTDKQILGVSKHLGLSKNTVYDWIIQHKPPSNDLP